MKKKNFQFPEAHGPRLDSTLIFLILSYPMAPRGGDDLDDDFLIDVDLALDADDGLDDQSRPPLPRLPDEEDEFILDTHPEEEQWDGIEDNTPTENDGSNDKKRKRKEKAKEKRAKKRKVAEELDAINGSQNNLLSPEEISSYLASMQTKVFKDMTQMELDDILIPTSSIIDTSSYTGPRTDETLPDFINSTLPQLATRIRQKPKHNGSPTALIISGAALRVTDLTRSLRPMKGEKGGEIAKLFAKHFKLTDHISYLQKTKIGVGVGTPDRIGKLLSAKDALQTSALTHVILDSSYQDTKRRTLFDIPETRKEVFEAVLGQGPEGSMGGKALMQLIVKEKVKLVLF
ncbi:hypothetical protein FRC02_010873 [Tulasnella sp. 418]|nr:hypothetical protein FRC02_010873 [Tulasnella sp. 418]